MAKDALLKDEYLTLLDMLDDGYAMTDVSLRIAQSPERCVQWAQATNVIEVCGYVFMFDNEYEGDIIPSDDARSREMFAACAENSRD